MGGSSRPFAWTCTTQVRAMLPRRMAEADRLLGRKSLHFSSSLWAPSVADAEKLGIAAARSFLGRWRQALGIESQILTLKSLPH